MKGVDYMDNNVELEDQMSLFEDEVDSKTELKTNDELKEAVEHNFGEDISDGMAQTLTTKEISRLAAAGKPISENTIKETFKVNDCLVAFLRRSVINGNNRCAGHTECDAIIMDNAIVHAKPEIVANHIDASLIHEAAIGKIAGDQILKLMTLGMTAEEAEEKILAGLLK